MSAYRQLSDAQQIILNLLPIPSAITSILGSAAVIHLAKERRKIQNWTPYTRLLVAMSICDIVFSLNIGVSTFLRPRETSYRLWAFGNDATCSFVAFVNQATTAGGWYQGMLSVYFLLTVRYGMKNAAIARRVEPLMHLLALGFPIGTAIAGSVLGVYGERAAGSSCYVSSYNDTDGASDVWHAQEKMSERAGVVYVFYCIPVILLALCLTYTQLSIYFFVRIHTRRHSFQENESGRNSEDSISSNADALSLGWRRSILPINTSRGSSISPSSTALSHNQKKSMSRLTKQELRLQLVCSQAFLFVMSFVTCNIWNLVLVGLQKSSRTRADEMAVLVKYYPVVVIQTMLFPIQGLFNCLIYCRPKYMILRLEFPNEGRLWNVKRTILGDSLRPTAANGNNMRVAHTALGRRQCESRDVPVRDTEPYNKSVPPPLPHNMVSSLTASDGDFDDSTTANNEVGRDKRWHDAGEQVNDASPAYLTSSINRLTILESISELSESVFDLTPYQTNGSHLLAASVASSISMEPSESRWKGAESSALTPLSSMSSSSAGESSGSGMGNIHGKSTRTDSTVHVSRRKSNSVDVPLQVPRRTSDILMVTDWPIAVPKRTSDPPIDTPTQSCMSSSEYSPGLDLKRVAGPRFGSRGNLAFDIPLALPARFTSLPPSETEDE